MMQRKNSEVRVESVRADWKKSTLALFVATVVLVVVLLIISSFLRLDAIGAIYFYCVRCYQCVIHTIKGTNIACFWRLFGTFFLSETLSHQCISRAIASNRI